MIEGHYYFMALLLLHMGGKCHNQISWFNLHYLLFVIMHEEPIQFHCTDTFFCGLITAKNFTTFFYCRSCGTNFNFFPSYYLLTAMFIIQTRHICKLLIVIWVINIISSWMQLRKECTCEQTKHLIKWKQAPFEVHRPMRREVRERERDGN